MDHIQGLLLLTEQLQELLDREITSKNREKTIEQIDYLIEMRGKYLQKVAPPFTEEEKEVGRQIIDKNVFIQKKMDCLFSNLKDEMRQVKQKKQSNRSYLNPYKSVQALDGMFMDKKK